MPRAEAINPKPVLDPLPVVRVVEHAPSIEEAFLRFAHKPHCLLLESASHYVSPRGNRLGRYSFLTADPFAWLEAQPGELDAWQQVTEFLNTFRTQRHAGCGPFQGGLAGIFSYDLNRSLETIPPPEFDEFSVPAIALGAYDIVIVWDHLAETVKIVSQGLPETNLDSRRERAEARANQFRQTLLSKEPQPPTPFRPAEPNLALAPQFQVNSTTPGLTSNFSADRYIHAVQSAVDYIYAGDVFQINLAQRLLFPSNGSAAELYQRLRKCNPAPFAGYFDIGPCQIVSASPERFLSVRNRVVETRPIKGTRRRTRHPEVDLQVARELEASEKDRAENIMIVDLMRNDLSRVCRDDSIKVQQLCELETYHRVLHLVSSVEGTLRDDATLVDLLKAAFPGGSITGAPKVRAMEIIAELEPTARGAYCGSLGYLGFDGNADLNILIRTITAAKGYWQIPVGGGIVAQSQPQNEYEETWTKAAGMLAALKPTHQFDS